MFAVLWFGFAEASLDVSPWSRILPSLLAQDLTSQSHVVFRYIEEVDECKDCIVLSRLDDNADIELPVLKETVMNHDLEFGSQRGCEILAQGRNLIVFVFLCFFGQEGLFFHVKREAVHWNEHGVGEPSISVRNKHVQFSDVEIPADHSNAWSID